MHGVGIRPTIKNIIKTTIYKDSLTIKLLQNYDFHLL
jgi:hypothetical protein